MELKVHDVGTVAFAVRLIGAGQVAVRPVVGLPVGVRVTEPTKFWVLVSVTDIDAPEAPLLKLTGVTAEIVKSPTWTVMVVEFVGGGVPAVAVPVSKTAYAPLVEEFNVQEAIAVPPRGTVAVVQPVTVTPEGVELPVKVTDPLKPWRLVTVMLVEPEAPVLKLEFVAVREKPGTWPKVKTAFALWDAVPGVPFPVMTTVKLPVVVEVQITLELPVPLAVKGTLVAVNGLQERLEGTVSLRATVPAKLNVLVRVIVDVSDAPTLPLGDVALMVKSPT